MLIYDGSKDKIAQPTKHTVAVISANRLSPTRDWMTIRKNGRQDWSLFYCESGQIYFEDQILQAGEIWLYPPHVPQKYIGFGKDRVIYHYLHFTGSDLAQLLHSLDIKPLTPFAVNKESTLKTMGAIESAIKDQTPLSHLTAEYHTLFLFSKIASTPKRSAYSRSIRQVMDEMEHDFATKYDAARYAKLMNLSESRFNHLFKQEVGLSPYVYFLDLRINNAATLLEQTDLRINQIAQRSGFEDALYFTQAFKKCKGLTPTQYRKQALPINNEL